MPDFGNSFSGVKFDRNLTKEELIRAIRFLIAAEYEAVQLYTQLADSINDIKAQKVLKDIAEEEVVHAGEFLRLLVHLRPEEFKSYLEGIKETEDILKNARHFALPQKSKKSLASTIKATANWMLIETSIMKAESNIKNLKDWIDDLDNNEVKEKILQVTKSLEKNVEDIKKENKKSGFK